MSRARSSRQRDHKAEYARRIANAAKKGISRQRARGHQKSEHVERRRRAILNYGAPPATLTKWRKKAFAHVLRVMASKAQKPINEDYLRHGFELLHIEDLRACVELGGTDATAIAAVQEVHLALLSEWFPYSDDLIEEGDEEGPRNPFWYH